jgi:hypothetical protein
MSRKEKLLLRLYRFPPPKDFSWEELATLMRHADFQAHCNGGSHFLFEHTSGFRFSISKTHPSGILKRYQLEDAKAALEAVGFMSGSYDEQERNEAQGLYRLP